MDGAATEKAAADLSRPDQLNAAGGVGKRMVEIRTMDDGYEPDRCAENTRKLIADEVFALFGYIGTPTSLAALPLFNQ